MTSICTGLFYCDQNKYMTNQHERADTHARPARAEPLAPCLQTLGFLIPSNSSKLLKPLFLCCCPFFDSIIELKLPRQFEALELITLTIQAYLFANRDMRLQ